MLKGTPNSVIDWIQVRAVWGPHVRLNERDVLTPQVRQCVPGSVCFYRTQGSVATHLRCGGIFRDSVIANILLILTVKEF